MFKFLVSIILRYRLVNLGIIFVLTAFMSYHATRVDVSYEFAQMLPHSDSTSIIYEEFKQTFGEDGAVMVIGINDERIFDLDKFNAWYDLTYNIKSLEGIEEVVSLARVYQLVKNDSLKKFDFEPIIKSRPGSQQELDSLKDLILSYPFYQGFLYSSTNNASLMMITLNKGHLNTGLRMNLVNNIKDLGDEFSEKTGMGVHYSGLPYIRTKVTEKMQKETLMFTILALVIASVILLIFFRSFKAVMFTMIIVLSNVAWVFGLIALLGYKITILTGILPPLMTIIVVENCIFLLNKFHHDFRWHGNKIRSLSRMVQRIGNANLMTNATTAAGFAAFIITGNKILVEFGITASISILVAYALTLFLVPIIFSYLPDPKYRHIQHLEYSNVSKIISRIVQVVENHRNLVYIVLGTIILVGLSGLFFLKTTGRIVDDISRRDVLYKDLMFIEKNFGGVMPLEIVVDTEKKRGVLRIRNIEKLDEMEQYLDRFPESSKSISLVDVVKFSRQAFYGGDSNFYALPNNQEMNFMMRYLPKFDNSGKKTILNSFIDTNMQVTRISTQMANIGTPEIEAIKEDIQARADSIFPEKDYHVNVTGTSVVYQEGSRYLIRNLASSLVLAIIVITLLMALLFTSMRMILISLVPNLIPLLMTAGMMGFLGITVKPSTILIFSIALGISVDNAIHFLSRYRLYLIFNNWQIRYSAIAALKETGYSMVYSSVVLFFGFSIFILSSFGGTQALGYLISFTLLMALLSNLFILPSLILSLNRRITTKAFKEPLLDIFDEEIDIELEQLEIEGTDSRGIA
jgi:predicted RND superfamily exporter protein